MMKRNVGALSLSVFLCSENVGVDLILYQSYGTGFNIGFVEQV